MNGQRLKGMLGLALRARKAVLGTDASRILIRSGKCGVLLLDEAAGVNTRKKAEDLCRQTGTPIRTVPEHLIGDATGRSNIVMGVQDGSFAEQILAETERIS